MRASNKTRSIAFSGLTIALIVVLLFIASMVDVLDYTISAACGIIVTFILVEFGNKCALSVYFGASIFAVLLVPNKINAILFVAFCGWYPFVKRYFEKAKEPVGTLLKFIAFNISLTLIVFVSKKVFLFENISYTWFFTIYAISNFTFILYDILITKMIWLYVHKYRKKLNFPKK